jgi:hypothetical protein
MMVYSLLDPAVKVGENMWLLVREEVLFWRVSIGFAGSGHWPVGDGDLLREQDDVELIEADDRSG